jgi:hypothetical protein
MNTNLRKLTEEEIFALCRAGDERKIKQFCEEMGTDKEKAKKKIIEWLINYQLSTDTMLQLVRAIEWSCEKNAQIINKDARE